MAEGSSRAVLGGKGRLGDRASEWDAFWRDASPEAKVAEIFELRRIYHEVIRPGTGAPRLDRSVGGVRRRGA